MATITLTGTAGRIWKLGHAIEIALAGECVESQTVSVIVNDNFSVTLPSGTVVGPV